MEYRLKKKHQQTKLGFHTGVEKCTEKIVLQIPQLENGVRFKESIFAWKAVTGTAH